MAKNGERLRRFVERCGQTFEPVGMNEAVAFMVERARAAARGI